MKSSVKKKHLIDTRLEETISKGCASNKEIEEKEFETSFNKFEQILTS